MMILMVANNLSLSMVAGRDEDVRVTLCPDRSVGGTSLASGEMELLLHRRLIGSDYPVRLLANAWVTFLCRCRTCQYFPEVNLGARGLSVVEHGASEGEDASCPWLNPAVRNPHYLQHL